MNYLSYNFGAENKKNEPKLINFEQRLIFKKNASFFDQDYFIHGKKSGKSLYENYRWLPHLTKPMARALIQFTDISKNSKVLDFGCAKGFLVRALNEEGIDAYGTDISEYAIENSDKKIRKKLNIFQNNSFDFSLKNYVPKNMDLMIAKDVFEHITPNDLHEILESARSFIKKAYILIPLGDNGKYRIPDYEKDASHVIAEDEVWWENLFKSAGFFIEQFRYKVKGIKEQALPLHPEGNGHFIIKT